MSFLMSFILRAQPSLRVRSRPRVRCSGIQQQVIVSDV